MENENDVDDCGVSETRLTVLLQHKVDAKVRKVVKNDFLIEMSCARLLQNRVHDLLSQS